MNKIAEETVKNMMQQGERNGEDYIGEDGLLYCGQCQDRKSTRLNSSHRSLSRMPSSA